MSHSIVPPSGANAWVACPMWVTMNRLYPQGDSDATREGTAAHWVFEQIFAGRPVEAGVMAPNGVVVTQEMLEGADLFVDTVGDTEGLHIEEPIAIATVHKECFGTPDAWKWRGRKLSILDYKFGHRYVDEIENYQLIAYAAGILTYLTGLQDQITEVEFTVVQPRCYYRGAPVRTWRCMASDLRPHINILRNAAAEALGPAPVARTNPECRDCPGRHACQALQNAAYADAEYAAGSAPVELSAAAASLELRMLERALERLQSRTEGLREVVTAKALAGDIVPHHRIERKSGRSEWNLPPDQIIAMGQLMGADLAKIGVKTPAQARKLGIDESVISAYSVSKSSVALVPDDATEARRVFG